MYQKLLAHIMEDMPIKKRRFWKHFVSPPPQACSRTPKEANPFEADQVLKGTFPASQKSHSEFGIIHGSVAVTSADGPSEAGNARAAQAPDAVVTKGKTLASIEPESLVKKKSEDSKNLSVQVDSFTSLNDIHSGKNDLALGNSIPLKINRLHWDLNIMMDEWEKPNAENVNQQMGNTEDVTNNGIQNEKAASDPVSIPKLETPSSVLNETKGPDSKRTVLQVSSGLMKTEKTSDVFKTQDPAVVIDMNELNNNVHLDHSICTHTEQKNSTADIPVQHDKDMSRTPATGLCKLSSQSDTTEKSDSVSFGMPIEGKDPRLTSEDLSSGCNNSNVSGNNTGHVVSMECMSNLQAGYDSPMEDGELRDPDAYSWKNNDVNFSETGQLENGVVSTNFKDAFENNFKNGHQFCDYQDDANAKGQDGEIDDNGSQTRGFRARKYRKLSSHDKSPYNGSIKRKSFALMQHQRKTENKGYEVDFPLTCHESRSINPHTYHNSKDRYHSRLRRVDSGPPARGSEMSLYDKKPFPDKFSNEIYRPSTRKRFPADRDDSYENYRGSPFPRGKNKRKKNKKSGMQRGIIAPKEKEGYNERFPEKFSSSRDHKSSTNFVHDVHMNRLYRKSQSESSLCSATHVLNGQDRRPSDRVSRHSQWQENNQVEFSRRLKPDDNLRSLAMQGVKSLVVTNDRK
ncbi:uncharacterized protein LOC108213435 isoform X2 [Daucus carota subsp. sativus]|uniref:uncharacterized protein LOC108213435 isoform X2 n=1 Tax=Daucus carota subsp. sativus TaxID=79200 RepID=UPI0030833EB7